MSLIEDLTPTNLLEEKQKFLLDNSYNPQFTYPVEIDPESLLKFGTPTSELTDHAQAIVDETFHHRNEHDLEMQEGKHLDQEEVTQKIHDFLTIHNLEHKIKIIWSQSFLSRTTINAESIRLRLPVDFRRLGLLGMMYHEIGTHALRGINYEQQPWYKRKKKYGMQEYLPTEEGLASIHGLLPQSHPTAHTQAIRYLGVAFAQKNSFSELWNYLAKYIDNVERRWIICVRAKRGLSDTSLPGGFTKDLVYFQGLTKMVRWLGENNYRLNELYFGKLAVEDISKAVALNPTFEPLLPSFYTTHRDEYIEKVSLISKVNQI